MACQTWWAGYFPKQSPSTPTTTLPETIRSRSLFQTTPQITRKTCPRRSSFCGGAGVPHLEKLARSHLEQGVLERLRFTAEGRGLQNEQKALAHEAEFTIKLQIKSKVPLISSARVASILDKKPTFWLSCCSCCCLCCY